MPVPVMQSGVPHVVASSSPKELKPSATAVAIELLASAIFESNYIQLQRNIILANDFSRIFAGLTAVGAGLTDLAAAIRNPAVDKNDQAVIDDIATQLEAIAASLPGLVAEENAEDGVVSDGEETPVE